MTTNGLRTQRDLVKSKILEEMKAIEDTIGESPKLRNLAKAMSLDELKEFLTLVSALKVSLRRKEEGVS